MLFIENILRGTLNFFNVKTTIEKRLICMSCVTYTELNVPTKFSKNISTRQFRDLLKIQMRYFKIQFPQIEICE